VDRLSLLVTLAYLAGAMLCLIGSALALRWRNYRVALLTLIGGVLLLSIPYSTMSIESHVISVTLPIRNAQ
jgi:hypothetical protein